MKKAIVNLATRPNDKRGQHRLQQSIEMYAGDVDFFGFTNERQVGAPSHSDVPYGFKTFAIDYVRQRGYTQIAWLDAAVWLVDEIDHVWDYVSEHGILMQSTGHNCGNWSSDRQLEHFETSRDDAMNIEMRWAGFQFLDFSHAITNVYFKKYHQYSKEGTMLRGAWTNELGQESDDPRCMGTRHDQVVASFLGEKLKIPICRKEFAVYVGGDYGHKQGGDICFWSQGMS